MPKRFVRKPPRLPMPLSSWTVCTCGEDGCKAMPLKNRRTRQVQRMAERRAAR